MRVAVIGLGFMGSTHLKAWTSIPSAELAAVCTRDERKLCGDFSGIQGNVGSASRIDLGSATKYTDLRQLLDDPRVEAVDICLPTDLHAQVAIAAAEAGKHVLVEKPMALDSASARKMIAAAKKQNRVLMVAHVLRFMPEYEILGDLMHAGRIGVVRSATFRRRCAAPGWAAWLADPKQSGGGVFDLLIHDIDTCLALFGKPEMLSATGYESLALGVDVINAQLFYPCGLTVTVAGGWHHPRKFPFSMEYTVVADCATVEFSSAGRPPSLFREDGEIEMLGLQPKDAYRAEIEYFLECCKDNKSPDLCPPEASADAVALARWMIAARSKNGEKVPCHL